jgi:hypothetical protein
LRAAFSPSIFKKKSSGQRRSQPVFTPSLRKSSAINVGLWLSLVERFVRDKNLRLRRFVSSRSFSLPAKHLRSLGIAVFAPFGAVINRHFTVRRMRFRMQAFAPRRFEPSADPSGELR